MDLETTSREELAKELHAAFLRSGQTLALAESCTGGAIAASLTAIPGASKFFLGSIVAYSNDWKESLLGVPKAMIDAEGSVSAAVVKQMVMGLLQRTNADVAAAVTGMLGGTGTVWIATCKRGGEATVELLHAPSDRRLGIDFACKAVLAAILWKK